MKIVYRMVYTLLREKAHTYNRSYCCLLFLYIHSFAIAGARHCARDIRRRGVKDGGTVILLHDL